MTKKLILSLVLASFDPKLVPKKIFMGLPLLEVIHCCKLSLYAISRKTNEPNLRNDKKPSFGSNFGPFGTNLGPKIFFRGFYLY